MFLMNQTGASSGMLLNMRDLSRRGLVLSPLALAAQAAAQAPAAQAPGAKAAPPQPVRMPKKIRVGVLGLEGHTNQIYGPLNLLPDVEVVAYWSSDSTQFRRIPGAKRYDDWKAMLDSEKLDVVAVTNNNGERAQAIIEAARRKINVMAEKPLATDRAGLQQVRQAIDKNGISIGMMVDKRFDPRFMALKKIVADGTIGEVIQIASQISYKLGTRAPWFQKTSTYGGSITWVGIHMLDTMRWTSGREFVAVGGFETRKGRNVGEMETATASVLQLDNGGVATLRVDYLRPETASSHEDYRLRLAGTKGIAEFQFANGVTVITGDGPMRTITDLPPAEWLFVDYLNATYNGKTPKTTKDDIYRICEVTLAAEEAANKGIMVRIA
jgi:predicted dehydrogenase